MNDTDRKAQGSGLVGWLSILVVFVLSWAFWLVPVSWYDVREWLFPLLAIPFIALAGVIAFRTRSVPLGIMTVLSIFFPVIIIFVGMMIWGI
ncbi:hypothetical protein [Corynebacterium sp.]|uniref:hypothetical protein n=1 Tax=Corynebacterium sp. TaxID=1720 RepID=UPI0026DEFF7E|nr:hypothetical protein [Corynebacterium sp.]MDO5512946.1 hypothetical protein [Corynebacterium sp.]